MKDKYSTQVFWEEEDDCFVATCSEFPLLSAHGETREEAISQFQTVLEMAFESYEEDGIELPSPKTLVHHSGQFRIRIPKSLHKDLAETADKEGVSLNTYAVSLLSENHAVNKVFSEKTEMVERMILQLSGLIEYHRQELQVHTQLLNFQGSSPAQSSVTPTRWKTTRDETFYFHHTLKNN